MRRGGKAPVWLGLAMLVAVPAAAQYSLTTTFAGGNANEGVAFDVEAVGTAAVTLESMDLNIEDAGVADLRIYYRVGSFSGYETTPGAWTLHDTVSITSPSAPSVVAVDFADLVIPAGQTYGIAVISQNVDVDVFYSNGSNTYNGSGLEVRTGSGIDGNFNGYNSGRTVNATFYFSLGDAAIPTLGSVALLLLSLALAAFGVIALRR